MPELDMREGFDVGLEMSGSSSALNSMIDNMINGGRISLLGFCLQILRLIGIESSWAA